ncbi:hypothetical protein BP6252_02244 [Coleophoma cylindrospora]|uniref:DUF962-domain-containing protein n=1 Tax=Coleophoma cylindrospora TaxID=1849047 RepID=A0A3D8SEW7_9HELO|nr:hypothetical protein BP6252_02244 [Coleophoma cylindrospora]
MSLNLEKQLCFVSLTCDLWLISSQSGQCLDSYALRPYDPGRLTPSGMMSFKLIRHTPPDEQDQALTTLQATNSPTLIPLPSWLTIPNLPLNLGTIGAILYSGFYILLEPVAGSLAVPIILGWTAYSNHLIRTIPSMANKVAIGVEVVAWSAQFLGHGAFEKRAPALLDNLLQAVVLAPFFVWMEVLFKLGYRPELQARVEKEVQKEVAKFRSSKQTNGKAENGKTK